MLWTGDYSALMPANLITSAHFSVSSAMSLAKSARKRRAAEVGGVPFCLTRYWAMVDNRARLGFSPSNLPRDSGNFPLGAVVKNSISFMSRPRKAMSEWVVHCEVNHRHIRRSQPTREAALEDACSQLLQGHTVNRIVGPNETITAERVRDWCAKHRP